MMGGDESFPTEKRTSNSGRRATKLEDGGGVKGRRVEEDIQPSLNGNAGQREKAPNDGKIKKNQKHHQGRKDDNASQPKRNPDRSGEKSRQRTCSVKVSLAVWTCPG